MCPSLEAFSDKTRLVRTAATRTFPIEEVLRAFISALQFHKLGGNATCGETVGG